MDGRLAGNLWEMEGRWTEDRLLELIGVAERALELAGGEIEDAIGCLMGGEEGEEGGGRGVASEEAREAQASRTPLPTQGDLAQIVFDRGASP